MGPMGPDRNGVLWARAQLKIALAHLDAALDTMPGRFAVEEVAAAAGPTQEAAQWLQRHAAPAEPERVTDFQRLSEIVIGGASKASERVSPLQRPPNLADLAALGYAVGDEIEATTRILAGSGGESVSPGTLGQVSDARGRFLIVNFPVVGDWSIYVDPTHVRKRVPDHLPPTPMRPDYR